MTQKPSIFEAGTGQNIEYFRFFRLGAYLVILFLAIYFYLSQGNFLSWDISWQFLSISMLGLGLQGMYLFIPKPQVQSFENSLGSFILDILLIGCLDHLSGLSDSLFLFAFMIILLSSGIILGTRASLLLAALTSLCFSLLRFFGPELVTVNAIFILIVNNIAFFATAYIGGVFASAFSSQASRLKYMQFLNELMMNAVPVGIFSIAEDGSVLLANQAAQHSLGIPTQSQASLEKHWPTLWNNLAKFVDSGAMTSFEITKQVDQQDRIFQLDHLPQNYQGEKWSLITLQDLTEKKRLEEKLRRTDRLAAIGGLAAGIAHEIRNPLAGISGSVELLSQNSQTEDDKKLFKIILKEIDRLNRLIGEFLDYAKPDSAVKDRMNLTSLIEEVKQALKVDEQKQVQLQLEPNCFILGNRDKLKQVILNMLINSLQAVQNVQSPQVAVLIKKQKEDVLLQISDNGVGMSSEIKVRMFEPFFTTKPKGTGLGLAISHKILESHGASVQVESEVNKGTKFEIHFPQGSVSETR